MKKLLLLASALTLLGITSSYAQTDSKVKTKGDKTKIKSGDTKVKTEGGQVKAKSGGQKLKFEARPTPPGFSLTPGGLQYKMVVDAPGTNTPKLGDNVEMHINTHIGDSSLFNSRKLNNNQPVPFQIMPPSFKGDLVEGFMMMTPGDSAVFRVSIDSLKKAGAQLLPWMKNGDMIEYEVVMVSVKSADQVKKEAAENASKQVALDETLLQDYFKKNNIKPMKTASGLYYTIANPGTGEGPRPGEQVTVNYTGKTLDGNVFDSNIDPKFNHVQPFSFAVGQGQVIKGWDEGLMLLKKGGKATFYIPSTLAYGERSPSPAIPANSVLIFDVDVTDITPVRMEPIKDMKHDDHDGHKH
jgi:FKBP-type peptidyl-prolyl cis-trans isomerase FkpA